MTLVLITLTAALGVGYVRGGRLRRLLDVRPRRGRLVLTALLIAVAGVIAGWTWPPATTVLWTVTLVAVAWFCWLNRAIHGVVLVAIGLVVRAVTIVADEVPSASGVGVLGDVIPVALPWSTEQIGVGDVLIAAGLAAILATSMVTPAVAGTTADETLAIDEPKEHLDGQESTQAQGPQEEQGQPRQAAQQLIREARPTSAVSPTLSRR